MFLKYVLILLPFTLIKDLKDTKFSLYKVIYKYIYKLIQNFYV